MKIEIEKTTEYKGLELTIMAEVSYTTVGEVDGHRGEELWQIEDMEIYAGDQEIYDSLSYKIIQAMEIEAIETAKKEI